MRRLLITGLSISAAAIALAAPAGAAPRPQIVDLVGDANGVNGQGLGPRVPTAVTPQDLAAADIMSVRFATRTATIGHKQLRNALAVTMTLADAPARPIGYGVTAQIPGSCPVLVLHYQDFVNFQSAFASCGETGSTASERYLPTTVAVDGAAHTITWTIDTGLRRGTALSQLQATSSAFVLGVLDYAASPGSYRLGS